MKKDRIKERKVNMMTTENSTLDILIPRYGENKNKEASLKKDIEKDNSSIKELMAQLSSNKYEVDGWVASYSTTEKESLDEDKLLQILKNAGITKAIKTVEILDMDILEDMLYKNEIPENIVADMDGCRNSKQVVTLRVTKNKKKKESEE